MELLQDIYHAIKFENANFTKKSAIAKNIETRILELSNDDMSSVKETSHT